MFKQPVSIDGIEFDALIESQENYSAEIPQYPTEKGYSVSDNITCEPLALSMTVFVSKTPVTHLARFGGPMVCQTRVEDVVSRLVDLYEKKKLVTVVTADRTYKNMGIESFSISKALDIGYAREIPISFREVIVTSTDMVSIPASYGKSGSTGVSAGRVSTASKGAASSGKTLLKSGVDYFSALGV